MLRRARTAIRRRRALVAAWRGLAPAERRDFVGFAVLIPAIGLALRLFGFRRVRGWLVSPELAGGALAPAGAEGALVTALRRAARYAPYRGNCLSQSLALGWRLQRRGVRIEFHLGARLDETVFSAHAWVESGGRVLNDAADVRERFAPFQPPPQAPPAPTATSP